MDQWKGRVALVTGASSGIGAATCKELMKHGMTVVGCGRNVQKLQAIATTALGRKAAGRMHVIQCDLSKEAEITKMFDEIKKMYGKVDICINKAGFGTNDSLASGDTKGWRDMLDVNIMALCLCTKKSLELMKEREITDGVIIHIGSVMGHKVPDAEKNKPLDVSLGFYYGTKFMIRGLAESLRQELKSVDSRIRVSTISPGAVETEFFSRALNQEAAKKFYSTVKCLKPEHIAEAVVNVLKAPSDVNVQDIMVQPVDYFM